MSSGRFLLPALLISAVFLAAPAGRAQEIGDRPAGNIRVQFGIDSLERKYYRPEFSLSWPVALEGRGRAFLDLNYHQRINGSLEGPIDFWIRTGMETRLSDSLSIEASLNHFCRHQTSIFTGYILNLNELIGRIWLRKGAGIRAGLGFGAYVGGSPGYDGLVLFNLLIPHLFLPEISLESEVKWVNFEEFLYETGLSIALSPGTELILTAAKLYRLHRTTRLGLRFRPEGPNARFLDRFDLAVGAYPFFDTHKVLVNGAFRLVFLREASRRFFFDLDFHSPILSGSGFFGQFWPDRMLYTASAEYERPVGGIFAAWYGRYFVDMPADKAVPFRASLATGLALRNQPDFNRLERPVRFEIRAGFDFKDIYDLGLKLGLNTTGSRGWKTGGEFRTEINRERRAIEALAFFDFGREVSVRPFIGIRRVTSPAGGAIPGHPLQRILTVGISFHKWFQAGRIV